MNHSTETLTAKLHARSDRRLEAEIAKWLNDMPALGGIGQHHIPCVNGSNLGSVLCAVKESLTSHLVPIRRNAEVVAFLDQVNSLQDVLDNK